MTSIVCVSCLSSELRQSSPHYPLAKIPIARKDSMADKTCGESTGELTAYAEMPVSEKSVVHLLQWNKDLQQRPENTKLTAQIR